MIKSALAITLALLATSAAAETLVTNVNGIQVGSDGKLHHFTGLLIDDNGKVQSVLTGPPPAKTFEQTIDGGGRTLLPGVIDAHAHVMDLGLVVLRLDVTGARSLAEVQERLRDYAAKHKDAQWILGFGWNQELWADRRYPTAADLDAVVRDRPVLLERVDGHAIVTNSAAMKAAGVTPQTPVPAGGEMRDGLFVDAARELIERIKPAPTKAELDAALDKAQSILLSYGVTAVGLMSSLNDPWRAYWDAYNRAGENGTLNVRLMSYTNGIEPLKDFARPTPWLHGDHLRMVGVKFYADGALGSRGAWLKQPYSDKPDTSGLQFHSDAEMLKRADFAAAHGFQIATHAIGDAANTQLVGIYEQLSKKYGRDRRWRIEHFQIADPADIPRLASAGIIASMQPTHQTSDRTMAETRVGPARLTGAYAWQTVAQSGSRIAFGSDVPVESPNPFPGLAAAVSRQDMNGQPPGGWRPQERVSFDQALSGFTRDAAYASFAEDKIGSLEPGKWADFILVDRDVSTADPQALARTEVLETWVAGKKVWDSAASAGGERGK